MTAFSIGSSFTQGATHTSTPQAGKFNIDARWVDLFKKDDDDIIKNNVTVTFGRGEMNEADAFADWVADKGLHRNQKHKIENSTVRAWLKTRGEEGLPVTCDAENSRL